MTELRIELLGGFRVSAAGQEVRVPSRKARALLACLALQPGQSAPRDLLATLLWEDSDPELGRASLRQALASLRRALPEPVAGALVTTVDSVALDAAQVSSDVAGLRRLLRDASPYALVDAAARHPGTLLEGFDARSSAFEAWVEERRRELRRDVLNALQKAASQCLATADLGGATEALARLVAIEPANERAQRDLMDVLGRQGRYTEALRQYRAFRDVLRRDLDVAPEPATEALYRELLRRRRATTPGPEDPDATGSTSPVATVDETGAARPADSRGQSRTATLREAVVVVARLCHRPGRGDDDPEALRERWSRAARRLGEVVRKHGGLVERLGPGEAIAVFGLGLATGSELDRALRAALELKGSNAEGSPVFSLGVAQGQVLPAAAEQPFPLAGTPVALAQELARHGDANDLRVAPEVAIQLGDRYELAAVADGAPAGSRRVSGARRGAGAGAPQRFAGRRAELAMVLTLLDRVVEARRGRAVVVRGDPGIGKSMLLEALAQAARVDGIEVRSVHALDFGQAARDRPAPSLAMQLLGIPADADDEQRRQAIARAVADGTLPPGDELPAVDLLGVSPSAEAASLLATMDNSLRERNRARVLRGLVAHAAASRPQVIIVEDVHWADSAEVGQLGDLAAAIATLPVLLALSTRSDDDPISAAWRARARGCPVTMLDLAPLADDEARELAARYADLPDDVVERCLETAAGHPLFLEQLLRSARAGQSTLPGSVRALLLARLERLPAESQRVLHAAATLGVRFSTAALRHVLGDPDLDCSGLESTGLIVHEGEECRFAHALIRTAIYESLLRSTRRDLHRHAAGWYESRDCGLYADHLAAAEDPLAATAQLRAAAVEQRAHRLGRALVHAERALELARDGHERFGARALLGDVYLAKGRTEDAIAAFRGSIDLAATRDERVRALLGLATCLRILDRYDEALAALDQAEQGTVDGADPQRLAQLWTLRGNLHFPRGELDACLHAHQRALELAAQASSPEEVARALGGVGDAQYQRGRMRTAHEHFQRCIALCEEHGIAGLRLAYLPMLSVTHCYLADFGTAREICEQVAASAARAGDLRAELLAHGSQASITYYRAEYAASTDHSAQSLARARELGARRFEAEACIQHGLALSGLGRHAEALEMLEDAVALARVAAPTYCGPWALAALARVCDDEAISRALLAEGESLLARGSVSHNHLEYRMHAIDVSLRFGDPESARRHAAALEDYTREEPLPWAELVIARARALARAHESGLDDATLTALRRAFDAAEAVGFHSQGEALRAALAAEARRP